MTFLLFSDEAIILVMKIQIKRKCVSLLLMVVTVSLFSQGKKMKKIEAFENSKVTLTDSYYVNATDKVVKNILTLDADRLLAGFRENAVLAWNSDPSKEMITATEEVKINKGKIRYGGWENTLSSSKTKLFYCW